MYNLAAFIFCGLQNGMENTQDKNNLVDVILVLLKWRKHIIIVCAIAAIGSAIISLLLPNYYKSTCIFYPLSPKLADSRTLYMKDVNYNIYGHSDDVDRLISISNSSLIVKDMIKEFDLLNHYKIDSSEFQMYDAMKEFRENLEVIRNDQGAIELSIYDQSDSVAEEMVRTMVGKVNYINLKATLDNNKKTLTTYEEHVKNKALQLGQITDSLKVLKNNYQILNPDEESKLLAQKVVNLKGQLATAKAKGQNSKVENLKKELIALDLDNFNAAADIVKTLDQQLLTVAEEYNDVKESYLQTKSAINNQLQTLSIIEDAIRAEKKSKPVRWVIVVATTAVTFLLSCLLVLIINFYQSEVKHLLDQK